LEGSAGSRALVVASIAVVSCTIAAMSGWLKIEGCTLDATQSSAAPPPEEVAILGPSRITAGTVEVDDSLPKRHVTQILARHQGELRFCHENNPQLPPHMQVTLELSVSAKGSIDRADPDAAAAALDPAFVECITHAARRWTLPAPENREFATVRYPISFDRAAHSE
jgi:hypothetical protein